MIYVVITRNFLENNDLNLFAHIFDKKKSFLCRVLVQITINNVETCFIIIHYIEYIQLNFISIYKENTIIINLKTECLWGMKKKEGNRYAGIPCQPVI